MVKLIVLAVLCAPCVGVLGLAVGRYLSGKPPRDDMMDGRGW